MQIQSNSSKPESIETTAVVIGAWADQPLAGTAKSIDDACEGRVTRLIEAGEVATEAFSTTCLYALPLSLIHI